MNDWNIVHLLSNRALIAGVAAQATAQGSKAFTPLLHGRPPDFRRIFQYGGMPSGHISLISGAMFGAGISAGWGSPLFAIAAVFYAIQFYDILKLRRVVELNRADIGRLLDRDGMTPAEKVPQLKAHTLAEIIGGTLLGAAAAAIVCLLMP